jgi:tRNA 5-methylaminomethyl-2-thiouridine biosynthesis bifunctional protein
VPEAVLQSGVLRLARDDADMSRLIKIAGQAVWPTDSLRPMTGADVAALLNQDRARPGLWLRDGLVVEPARILAAWLAGAERMSGRVVDVTPGAPVGVRLEEGQQLSFDAVVIAAGWDSVGLGVGPLSPVRGQVAWADGIAAGQGAVWGPGYAVPTRSGALVGATHERGRTDLEAEAGASRVLVDRLSAVRPKLAAALAVSDLSARVAIRATTPDHRPLCGASGQGVWMLTGLGGRGFAWAPLLAEHLVAQVCATTSPLSGVHIDLIAGHRFAPSQNSGDRP